MKILKGHAGLFLIALAVSALLIPSATPIGGAPGLGVLLHLLTGFPPGMIILVINLFCCLFACLVQGWSYGMKTLYAAFFLSISIDLLHWLLPKYHIAGSFLPWGAQSIASLAVGLGLWWAITSDYAPAGTAALATGFQKLRGWPVIYSLWSIDLGISLGAAACINVQTGIRTFFGACVMYFLMLFLKGRSKSEKSFPEPREKNRSRKIVEKRPF